ncbi:MAG: hypothetical protein Q7R99_03585 [bacterium]|nr:hypothetical protein [bacterium]
MNKTISFDLHDTIIVFKTGGKLIKRKFFYIIFCFLSNFKSFIFTYTFFCKRNEPIIELMKHSKAGGDKVIILTYTHKRCAKIIYSFLRKNDIKYYDEVIFRREFWQNENDYKIEEIQKNNSCLHYDNNIELCDKINKIKSNSCVVVSK